MGGEKMRCMESVSILEIMRLWEQGLSQREIARGANCGKSTVNDVQRRCRQAGLTYGEACGMSNTAIRARLYPRKETEAKDEGPAFEAVENG